MTGLCKGHEKCPLCGKNRIFLCAIEMDQAVCHQPLNAEVWHLSLDSQDGISFEGCNNGRRFPLSTSISPCQQRYTNIPHSFSFYCHFYQKEKQAKSFFYRVALRRYVLSSMCQYSKIYFLSSLYSFIIQ